MRCFYKYTLDGICAAYWVNKYCCIELKNKSMEFIPVSDREAFPIDLIDKECAFLIGDIIPTIDVMDVINNNCKSVIWISNDTKKPCGINIKSKCINEIRCENTSNCALTYLYLFRHNMSEYDSIPLFTKLIHKWVVNQLTDKNDSDLFEFIYGLYGQDELTPKSKIFEMLYINPESTMAIQQQGRDRISKFLNFLDFSDTNKLRLTDMACIDSNKNDL